MIRLFVFALLLAGLWPVPAAALLPAAPAAEETAEPEAPEQAIDVPTLRIDSMTVAGE